MICTPLSVQIGSLISPTLRENPASSNGFCIAPRPKEPKSPPFFAEEQSEYFEASSAKDASPLTICSLYESKRSNASSFVRVMLSDLHEEGLLDSLCLTKR